MQFRFGVLVSCMLGCATIASAAPAHYPQTAPVGGHPTAAEAAVIRRDLGRSFGKEWSDYVKATGHAPKFSIGNADLNGDGRPDLLVSLSDGRFGYCGSGGCAGYAILATPRGYAANAIDLAYFFEKAVVLPRVHRGMHDLRFDDGRKVFVWDGRQYR